MKKIICTILSLIIMLSFAYAQKESIIIAATARLTGKITSPNNQSNAISITITVPHLISGEYVKHQTFAKPSGEFSFEVDVETDTSLIGFYTSINPEKSLLIKLASGATTNVDISYNSEDGIKNIETEPAYPQNDMTRALEVVGEMIEFRPDRAPTPLYDKRVDFFLDYINTAISERLNIVDNDPLISKGLKEHLAKDFRLWMYVGHVFHYESEMIRNFRNTNNDQSKKLDVQKIDKSYFRFLRDFNLNDQQYLYCFSFMEFQKEILQNENLGLPVIGDTDIPSWLASVKTILSDLVGFDDGKYYDILVANAYGRQLNEEVKQLSEKQKRNISDYWKNGEIAKILFRKNEEVVELGRLKSPVVVSDVSLVSDDKTIETILSKYKGKVVFIDLWATWCSPCLDAMKDFRNAKNELRDENVAFIYLTNGSSPRKLWEEKIKGIGDEHYYLSDSQWSYVMDKFSFEAIPSYLLFDKEGRLTTKFTGFPGSKEVKDMIKANL